MPASVEPDVESIEALDFAQVCSIVMSPYIPRDHVVVDYGDWIPCERAADFMLILKCCGDQRLVCAPHLAEIVPFTCPRCKRSWPEGIADAAATRLKL